MEEGALDEAADEENADKIVRFKRFVLRPMTIDDAIEQMELLGHNFFAFLEAGSGKTNVLYRRKDGAYGQIQLDVT
ncbi:MAG: sigma 54 modulation/S30EA ribosomal C-terminal domain-containing protein, partial [Dehalococcoidia bacterium]|nr:sigma 54 modulation/S30EA ribosomal C-terminal domain-containing protein [Dehalococcoidia bacterium]